MAIGLDAAVEAVSSIGSLALIVVNLRPADNSVPHIAQLEQRDSDPTSTTRSSRKWVGSNDRHVSTKNIHQLWNLIDVRAT